MSTEDADSVPDRPTPISDRKARANAQNARRSTGPQTFDGKQRSSMNALKHGGFANRSVAIPRGTFAEDPAELECYIEAIIESLAPRDEDELSVARRIALCHVRAVRLNLLEAETLGAPEPLAPGGNPTRAQLEASLTNAQRFALWLSNGNVAGVNFDDILDHLLSRAALNALFASAFEPEPAEVVALSSQSRVEWYVEHHFANRADAVPWVMELIDKRAAEANAAAWRRHKAADKALQEIDRVSVISQRISRELELARREYRSLRQRLPDRIVLGPPRNEPTDS